jgi:hypothetical protein
MDDIFTYAGGVSVDPHVFRSALARQRAVIAYQVRQTARGAEVIVQLISELRPDDLRSDIEAGLRKVGVADPTVTVIPVDGLKCGATGKLKRFVPVQAPTS